MKKCLMLAFVLVSLIANAQTEEKKEFVKPTTKGNILLGGFVNFNKVKNTTKSTVGYNDGFSSYKHYTELTSNDYNFNLTPNLGYFISDGLAIGASLPLGYTFSKVSDGTESKSFSYGISPFVKYYFDFGMFVEGQVAWHNVNEESESDFLEKDFDVTSKSLGLAVGYAIFINSKVSIEPKLIYRWSKDEFNYEAYNDSHLNSDINSIPEHLIIGESSNLEKVYNYHESESKEDGLFFYIGFQIFL
ncbi:outer membrane beta-barrel protein [Carboxylicivirga sp. N1Y90]|uniref:outer membrane beta-barrel protein n=1 Tax=Carboxylicivirga fragile TaxID=3417571 RepID=UPI003D35680C|nr:outer membrane beta-barrel protein [Marinilabiliaceae bacterium N1Y90]